MRVGDPKNLIPKHLTDLDEGGTADLRDEATAAVAAATAPVDDKAGMRQESYTFPLDFTAENGKTYRGTFTHRCASMGQRLAIGALRAKLTGGMTYESLDPFTRELTMMVADLSITLEDKGRPEWAKDLRELKDADVIYRLWEVAALHEATFLGRRLTPG